MGGDGKGQDFTPLAKELKGRVAFAALIGRDAAKIREAVSPAGVATETFKTLEAAEDWLWEKSRPGDQILLSPACASWDMFRDYAERSERFKAEAAKIADHVVPKADEAVQG
jgi:UDP-N-acetylmuramoylalanine--D-glutamate ligase